MGQRLIFTLYTLWPTITLPLFEDCQARQVTDVMTTHGVGACESSEDPSSNLMGDSQAEIFC